MQFDQKRTQIELDWIDELARIIKAPPEVQP